MYVQYKPEKYIKLNEESDCFYYAVPGYNLIICDNKKNPVKIARYIGHFENISTLKKYKVENYQTFLFQNDFWTPFEEYKEDYLIIRDLRANIPVSCDEYDNYKKLYPQVFIFDETIADFICNGFNLKSSNIPIEVLNILPFNKFRIRKGDLEACISYDLSTFVIKTPDGKIFIRIDVNNSDFLDLAIQDTLTDKLRNLNKTFVDIYGFSEDKAFALIEEKREAYLRFVETIIPLVLYISSSNAEITSTPYRASTLNYPDQKPYENVQYVGTRTGFELLNSINSIQGKSYDIDEDLKVKKPHIRKAHFHHYWVNNSTATGKKLILKWLAPIIVNGYAGEEKERHIR